MKEIGSRYQPIEIEDDPTEQETKEMQRKEYEANRQALYKAHLGSQFDVVLAVIKTDLHGTDEEKDSVIKNRINKFFSAQIKTINPEDQHFRPRRQPDYSSSELHLVPNELIIYGIDFISSKQLRKQFPGLEIELKCLDDSHCKIIFKNAHECEAGLKMNLRNENQYKVKIESEEMEIPKGWFELKPYYYLTFERKIQCRYAMSNQNDIQINRSNDHYMMMQAKKQFEQSIKSEVNQSRYFSTMMKYNLFNQNVIREKIGRNPNRTGRRSRDNKQQRRGQKFHQKRRMEENRSEKGSEYSVNGVDRRSRSKQNQPDQDSLSILSEALSGRMNIRQKPDLSICLDQRSRREQMDDNSNLSFMLNKSEIENAALMNGFSDFNLKDSSVSVPGIMKDCQGLETSKKKMPKKKKPNVDQIEIRDD